VKLQVILSEHFPFLNANLLKTKLSWSIRLRWLAASGYLFATIIAKYTFNLPIPYENILIILGLLYLANIVYYTFHKVVKEFSFRSELIFLSIHIVLDLVLLMFLLHYSGGIENPIFFFYLFHVVMSSIIFPKFITYILSTFVNLLFLGLIYLEYSGAVKHYSIFQSGLHDNIIYIGVTFIVFVITVYVLTYICNTFMDMYRSVKQELDDTNQQLVEADRQKTQFFRFTSHELKSPIITIKSLIDGIIKNYSGKLDERGKNVLHRASIRAEQMLQIIKELLILTQKRNILKKQEGELINFQDILNEVVEQEATIADEKRIGLITSFQCENKSFKAEKEDIQKVFINLVNNAFRYTDEGGIVSVACKKFKDKIQISVTDSGIGIPKDDQNKIFDEFYRSENAKKHINFGTGLGLSLVKQIVENYHGMIGVESEKGKGTTFNVFFPVSN